MERYQICNIHQKRVEFVSRDFNSNELIGLCVKCLPLPQGVPYQQISNIFMSFENNKTQMINVLEEQKQQNKKIIRRLIDYVKEFKKQQEEKIESLVNQGELEISKTDKKYYNAQKQISEYNASIDIKELSKLYYSLQNDNIFAETYYNLQELLYPIQQNSFLLDSYKILQEFPITMHLDLKNEKKTYLNKIQKCPKHNEIIIGIQFDQNKYDDLICFSCIKKIQNVSMTELEVVEKSWQTYHDNSRRIYQKFQKILDTLATQAIGNIFFKCDKIQNTLKNFLNVLTSYKISKYNDFNKMISEQNFSSIDYTSGKHLDRLKKIVQLQNDDWKTIKKIQNIEFTLDFTTISNILRCIKQIGLLTSNIQINQMNNIKTKKQYIQLSSYKQNEWCSVIAINTKGDILIGGCKSSIQMFEVNCGILNKLQQLDGHAEDVTLLEFMKNKNVFVSGSMDKTIKIWTEQKENQWIVWRTLHGHTGQINCIAITSKGDQIISGSGDDTVRFWSQNNQNWNNSSINSNLNLVLNFSLNESETKVICCQYRQVSVLEQVQNKWSVVQQIQMELGSKLCFITDDQFAYSLFDRSEIQIYQYSRQQKSFFQTKCIKLKDSQQDPQFFPLKFIKQQQILFSKFRSLINVIQIDEQGEFLPIQYIEVKQGRMSETVTDDGEYLIIWEEKSMEIQVKQCKDVISF